MIYKGNAIKFGDNIDTDVIIPARYLYTSEPKELAKYCMIDIDENFINRIQLNDIIVAGDNFGCGSSREHAPLAIKGAGISCIIAKSFARIFFRNSINIGLPILECSKASEDISEGDEIEIDLANGIIKNVTTNKIYKAEAFPSFLQKIINSGGLIKSLSGELNE